LNYPVIILGAGGHAKVLIDALILNSVEILLVTDSDPSKKDQLILGIPIKGMDDEVMKYPPGSVRLVNGIGSICVNPWRRLLFERFKDLGYSFVNVIHPSAIIASGIAIDEGAQIMAGVVIQTGCTIGRNTIINTNSTVDHDCHIGENTHIAPGVTLSGGIQVGNNTHIGTGATVLQGIAIGRDCLVAAGAVVIRDVPDGAKIAGIPAKQIR